TARAHRAVALLAEGQRVEDVAALVGFRSASAFSAAFRRVTGVTPGEIRQPPALARPGVERTGASARASWARPATGPRDPAQTRSSCPFRDRECPVRAIADTPPTLYFGEANLSARRGGGGPRACPAPGPVPRAPPSTSSLLAPMSRFTRRAFPGSALALAAALAACSSESSSPDARASGRDGRDAGAAGTGGAPRIDHAFATTEAPATIDVVTTVAWANHEVPLALGVVPAGMAAANFGDDDDNGMLPWVEAKLEELGAEPPVLFDESDGIDFEGVADTGPSVILAAYSGLTQEDYDTLSEIAPTIPYPGVAWGTPWRDMITADAT